jgi:hypothetical protein
MVQNDSRNGFALMVNFFHLAIIIVDKGNPIWEIYYQNRFMPVAGEPASKPELQWLL